MEINNLKWKINTKVEKGSSLKFHIYSFFHSSILYLTYNFIKLNYIIIIIIIDDNNNNNNNNNNRW